MAHSSRVMHPLASRRAGSVMRFIDLTVWIAAGTISVIVAGLVMVYGVEFSRVLSPSMAPAMPVGSVAVTSHIPVDDLRVGQVAILRTPDTNALYIHRITSLQVTPNGLVIRTKGDANPSPDPWTVIVQSREVAVLVFVLPVQRITEMAMHVQFMALPLFFFGILMTAYFGWYAMQRPDRARPPADVTSDHDHNEPASV